MTQSREQENENAVLQSRNNELLREVEELKTGTDAIEEMAREELGLIKDGETFYMILDSDDSDRNQEAIREQRSSSKRRIKARISSPRTDSHASNSVTWLFQMHKQTIKSVYYGQRFKE